MNEITLSITVKDDTLENALTVASRSRLNAEQALAAGQPINQAVQVIAGAGTGKTELIAHRFVHLVKTAMAQGIANAQNRIAVVTFTNEAARNMQWRIQRTLETELGLTLEEQALENICTFHQFSNRILQSHALKAGLSPEFSILDAGPQRLTFHRVINSIVSGEYDTPYFQTTLKRLFNAAELTDLPGDLFSIAYLRQQGFSTFTDLLNTDDLSRVIQQAKAAGLTPGEFYQAALSQSKKLSQTLQELPELVNQIFKDAPRNEKTKIDGLALMQSYCAQFQQHFSPWASVRWDIERKARQESAKKGKDDPTASHYNEAIKPFSKLLLNYNRSCKIYEPSESLDELAKALRFHQKQIETLSAIVSGVYALYQHTLRVKNACDFDDLINHCLHLFQSEPELAAYYRRQFLHVIVDEFQDSNTSQLRLLKYLAQPEQSNVTVVGDQKQSIYGFRFAQPDNLQLAFEAPGQCRKIPLHTNYRSTPPILAVCNALSQIIIGNTSQFLSASLTHQEASAHPVTWCTFGLPPNDEESASVSIKTPEKDTLKNQQVRQADWIAERIARIAEEDSGLKLNHIAVLVKSHSKAELIQEALNSRQIASVRKKNLGFFQDAAVKNALALFRLMQNLHDDHALLRVLQQKLDHSTLYQLALARNALNESAKAQQENTELQAVQYSLFDALYHLNLGSSAITHFFSAINSNVQQALKQLATELLALKKRQGQLTPSRLLSELASRIGVIAPDTPAYLKHQQRVNIRTLEKWLLSMCLGSAIQPTLQEILTLLEDYQNDPSLDMPIAEATEREDAVQIMTIHAAKGLEFPVVFVAWCEKTKAIPACPAIVFDPQNSAKAGFGLFSAKYFFHSQNKESRKLLKTPLQKTVYQLCWQGPQSEHEEQRLFYVALTRAQQQLYVLRLEQSPDWTAPPETLAKASYTHWIEADMTGTQSVATL